MNAGIEATTGRYVLALEPGLPPRARLRRDPRAAAGRAGRGGRRLGVGAALRAEGPELSPTAVLDSTGIFFTASGPPLRPRLGRDRRRAGPRAEEEVAGASGAAGFYRRAALESARISTGYFDADFFLYREDADLALAAAQPRVAVPLRARRPSPAHRRRNLPERRRADDRARQHALGQEPVPAAHQQPDGRRARRGRCVPTFGAGSRRARRLPDRRAHARCRRSAGSGGTGSGCGRSEGRSSEKVARGVRRLAGEGLDSLADRVRAVWIRAAIASPRAHRHPRHSRHSRPLRRLRDAGRGALGAARRARPRRHGLHAHPATPSPGSRPHRGAKIRVLPTIPTKYLDTVVHGALSGGRRRVRALRRRSRLQRDQRGRRVPAAPVRQDARRPERRRPRAPPPQVERGGQARVPDLGAALDDHSRRRRLGRARHPGLLPERDTASTRSSSRTAAICREPAGRATLERLGLAPERYVLYVSRLEPENNALEVVRAYRGVPRGRAARRRGRRALRGRLHRARARGGRSARPLSGRDLRRGVPGAARPRRGLRPGDRGRRHPPGARRGPGLRPRRLLQRHARERGGRRRRGLPFDAREPATLARLLQGILDDPAAHSVWKERASERVTRSDIVGTMWWTVTRPSLKRAAPSHNIGRSRRVPARRKRLMLKQKARAIALGVLLTDLALTALSLPVAWSLRQGILTDGLPGLFPLPLWSRSSGTCCCSSSSCRSGGCCCLPPASTAATGRCRSARRSGRAAKVAFGGTAILVLLDLRPAARFREPLVPRPLRRRRLSLPRDARRSRCACSRAGCARGASTSARP